jgi:hypothetical protein
MFFSAREPKAAQWDAVRRCDRLRRAYAPQPMEACKKCQGVDHGGAHLDRPMLQPFHQGTLERCHRCIRDGLLPCALREVTVTGMTTPTARAGHGRAAERHWCITTRTGIQKTAVVVETHGGACQPPTAANIRREVGGETTVTALASVGRSHPLQQTRRQQPPRSGRGGKPLNALACKCPQCRLENPLIGRGRAFSPDRAHGHIEHAVDVAVPPGVLWPQLPAKAIERRTMDKGETRQPGRSLRIRQWLEVDRQAAPAERHALRPSVHWPGGVGLRGAPSRVHAVKHDRSVRGRCGSPLRPPGAAHWPDRPSCLH